MPKFVPVVIAALLVAVPACKKKAAPTVPDSTPAPPPKPVPAPGQTGTATPPAPNPDLDSSLPAPPVQRPLYNLRITVAAGRTAELGTLKQVGVAFQSASDTLGGFPAGVADKNGKVGLSWRVALLPYLEQDGLYREFALDEPWDSDTNKRLIAKMPKVYAPGNTHTAGYTFLRSFSGPGTVMPVPLKLPAAGKVVVGVSLPTITDGASNTLIAAEAYDPVIWTKPDEPFSAAVPPKLGGGVYGNGFCALFADGSARFLPKDLPPTDVSSLIQTNDGRAVQLPLP